MAEIVCQKYEQYIVRGQGLPRTGVPMFLTLAEVVLRCYQGDSCALRVQGWEDPWSCFVDIAGHLRAICPTSDANISPRLISVQSNDDRDERDR